MSDSIRLFVSFPESVVRKPLLYEIVRRFDVAPNIRRADVEEHTGWIICELAGLPDSLEGAVAYLEAEGCTVNRMEGDVLAG